MTGERSERIQPKSAPLRWSERDERLWAQLALALHRPENVKACLDVEILAAFHEGRLSKTEENAVLEHVADCPDCYESWLDARDCISTAASFPVISWIKDFFQSFFAAKRRVWIGAVGTLAAACLILVFSLSHMGRTAFVLDEWMAAEFRGLVSVSPGGVVSGPPQRILRAARIKGFSIKEVLLSEEDFVAFTYGVRRAAENLAAVEPSWQPVVDRLPDIPAFCRRENGMVQCRGGREFLVAMGHWSAMLSMACGVPDEGNTIPESYWVERKRQIEHLRSRGRESSLFPEAQKTLDLWVQEASDAQGRDLCRLKPVVLVSDIWGGAW